MNFMAVKQANGQNVTILATFVEVGGVSFTANQKQVCKCQLIDDNGEQHLVRLYGTMPLPTLLNMRQQFSLSSYQGTNQRGQPYTGFSGFWNDRAMVNQVPGNAPPAPQAPQPPAQATNITSTHTRPVPPQPVPRGMNMPDTYAYPVTPETARRMARTAFIAAILQNGQTPLYSYITELVEYSYTGKEPMVDASDAPDPHPDITDQGICPHCGNLHKDCSCDPGFGR